MPFSVSVLLAEMQSVTEPFTAEILGGLYVIKLMTGKRVAAVSSIQQRSGLSTAQTYTSTHSILFFFLSEEMGHIPDRRFSHCVAEYRYEEGFLHLHHE